MNFKVVDQREDRRNVRIKKHTQKKEREKMVVKIPDPIPQTRPSRIHFTAYDSLRGKL